MAAFATLVCQRNCVFLCKGTKLQNSAKPNSGDSLPVFALECFSANETGGLGLWLGAFWRLRLYRCQSVPGPPMPCFVAQSFAFASGNSCFTNSRVQKLQKALLFAIVCRFFVAQSFAFAVFATLICQINSVFPCKDTKAAKSVAFCDSLPVFLWHRALFWQPLQPWFVKETAFFFAKAQNSGIRVVPDSGTGLPYLYTELCLCTELYVLAP